jgi:hypothetical protein
MRRVRLHALAAGVVVAALAGWPAAASALTATPSATATPRVVEIRGRVFDASQGEQVGIAGARVEYVQHAVRESRITDATGAFAFTLTVPDNANLPVWTTADGFQPDLQMVRAGDVRQAGTLQLGMQPAPPRTTAFIHGRVYDASAGFETAIPGATIQYRYLGSGVYPDTAGTLFADDDGLYGLSLPLGAADAVEFSVDAPGFATFRTLIGAFRLLTEPRIDFAIAPLGGQVQIEASTNTFSCRGSFEITIGNVASGDTLVILGIDVWHGYSQGDYGTGFTWDLSHLDFPVSVEPGGHISFPLSYVAGEVPSRLHVEVISGAPSGTARATYRAVRGDGCPSTPTPENTATPTPTSTPTPQRTGDLGTREIHGRVYDALRGRDAGIADATVSYGGPHGSGTVQTDAHGDFAFSLFLHDSDSIAIGAAANGYQGATVQRSGYGLWIDPMVDIGLAAAPGTGHRVWGLVTPDPYCAGTPEIRVVLQSFGGVPTSRSLVVPASNEYEFADVADGDYVLSAESDCRPSYAPTQTVYVRGADVYAPISFANGCIPVVVLEPASGPPGTVVSVSGRCSSIHSGAQADVYFDYERVGEVRGATSGHFVTQIRIPLDAEGGWHAIHVQIPGPIDATPIGSAGFSVTFDEPPICPGDCDGDGRVEVDELVTGVNLALHRSVADCPALVRTWREQIEIAELVSAVASALNGCMLPATPAPTRSVSQPAATPTPTPTATPSSDALARLMKHRALWDDLGATHYRMVQQVTCYCRHPHLVSIEVRDGQIVSVRDVWSGEEVAEPLPRNYRTIEEIFDLLADAIERSAYSLSVTYSPDVGAPLNLYINYSRAIVDEEIGYEITDLGIIRRMTR